MRLPNLCRSGFRVIFSSWCDYSLIQYLKSLYLSLFSFQFIFILVQFFHYFLLPPINNFKNVLANLHPVQTLMTGADCSNAKLSGNYFQFCTVSSNSWILTCFHCCQLNFSTTVHRTFSLVFPCYFFILSIDISTSLVIRLFDCTFRVNQVHPSPR